MKDGVFPEHIPHPKPCSEWPSALACIAGSWRWEPCGNSASLFGWMLMLLGPCTTLPSNKLHCLCPVSLQIVRMLVPLPEVLVQATGKDIAKIPIGGLAKNQLLLCNRLRSSQADEIKTPGWNCRNCINSCIGSVMEEILWLRKAANPGPFPA